MKFEIFGVAALLVGVAASLSAQWLNYPTPGTPMTRDGKPDLTAKAPRTSDGKPDLSGVWHVKVPDPGEVKRDLSKADVGDVVGEETGQQLPYFFNLFSDFKRGEEPITREASSETLRNMGRVMQMDSPTAKCLPYGSVNRYFNSRPFKVFQGANEIAMFFEVDGAFRQIHTDGRKLPVDPFPSWMGYSTGKWDGDTLVAETAGFNDLSWLDAMGHPHSEDLRVQERFHRRDFGHLDIELTLEDPKVLTKPVIVRFAVELIPNSDVLETFCAEGERDQVYARSQPH